MIWAASFGETVTAIELSPEGTGYRAKTRFARFFNLPELISYFQGIADVQTADMLNLPVPEAEYINEVLKPSEEQEEMVSSFADRAEAVSAGNVNPRRSIICSRSQTMAENGIGSEAYERDAAG